MRELGMMKIRAELLQLLFTVINDHVKDLNMNELDDLLINQIITVSIDKKKAEVLEKRGDFSLPLFKFAKRMGMNPRDLAREVAEKLTQASQSSSPPLLSRAWDDQGYVNMKINPLIENQVLVQMLPYLLLEKKPWTTESQQKKILIEHTSINPMKPLHIGHIRNAVLGDTLARVYHHLGWNVEVQNYIDDLGRQVAVTLWGMEQVGKQLKQGKLRLHDFLSGEVDESYLDELQHSLNAGDMKEDLFQGIVYVWASRQLETNDPQMTTTVEKIMQALEHRQDPYFSMGRELTLDCIKDQLKTVWRLGIFYDFLVWESDLIVSGIYDEVLRNMLETTRVYKIEEGKDKGCIVIDFKGFKGISAKKPYKILVRSNGVATYVAKDIAYTLWKFGLTTADLKFKKFVQQPNGQQLLTSDPDGEIIERTRTCDYLINVIGKEQEYAQKIVFFALKALGYEQQYQNSYHLAYDHVKLVDSKISGRKGSWLGSHADRVIDLTRQKALEELKRRNPDTDVKKLEKQAEKLAISQIRYFMLRQTTQTKITYNPDEVTNFQGDNGAFILYGLVRARSIFEKAKISPDELENEPDSMIKQLNALKMIEERMIIKDLISLPIVLKEVTRIKDPSMLVQHVFVLGKDFNVFYEKCPIMKEPDETIKMARLQLLRIFMESVKNICSQLLGMPIPEFM